MSLFKSKVFWFCAVVCIGITGFFGINAYKSQSSKEPVIIYKTTPVDPLVKPIEKPMETTLEDQSFVDQAAPSVETGDSLETDLSSVETFEADVSMFTPDDSNEDLTTDPPETIEPNAPLLDDFSAEDFAREMQEEYNRILNKYPLLSLPESEILKLIQTETGARELKRQADGLQADMIQAGNKYIPKLSDEEKQQVLEESRRLLSQYMTPDQIEEHLSKFNW